MLGKPTFFPFAWDWLVSIQVTAVWVGGSTKRPPPSRTQG